MFGSYSAVRSKTSMAIENSLRLSGSPSTVRFTMWVKNRMSRAEGMKPGLFTTRANCSRTMVAGTGSLAEWAAGSIDDEPDMALREVPTIICPRPTLRHLTCELTAAYVNSGAYRANLKSKRTDTDEKRGTNKHDHVCERQKTRQNRRGGVGAARPQSGVGKQYQGRHQFARFDIRENRHRYGSRLAGRQLERSRRTREGCV